MPAVVCKGVKINCRAAGPPDGRAAALFIHGLNTNMAFWHPLLVRRLGGSRRLLMFDLRGHGHSDLPVSGYTSADLANDALSVLDGFQVESADVVAHSFGAAVALQLARLAPERVRSLVILDGRLRLLQPELRLRNWSQFDRWQSRFKEVGITIDPDLEMDFRLPLRLGAEAWQMAREGMISDGFFVPSHGKRAAEKYRQLLTATNATAELCSDAGLTRESLRQFKRPIVAVYGSLSPYLPTCEGLRDEIPHCEFKDIPGAGHNFPFLRPLETAQAVEDFWLTGAS